MTRREVLKSLSVLSVSLTIPVSTKSLAAKRKSLKVIGIGWKGCHVADFFSKQKLEAEYIHINHTEWEDETVYSADKIYHLNNPAILYRSKNDGTHDFSTLSNEIKSVFNSNSHYIIAVKAGEKITTKMALAVINYLNDKDYEYFTFVYLPFGFEGAKKDKIARSVVNAIKNPEMSYVTDMRSVTRKHGSYTLAEVTEILNQKVLDYYLRNVY